MSWIINEERIQNGALAPDFVLTCRNIFRPAEYERYFSTLTTWQELSKWLHIAPQHTALYLAVSSSSIVPFRRKSRIRPTSRLALRTVTSAMAQRGRASVQLRL